MIPSLPAGFSLEKLKDSYRINVIQSTEDMSIVKLVPLIPSSILQELQITLDEKAIPIEISMTERTRDKIYITFPKREFNISIPDEAYSTRVPEGVKVRKRTK